MSMHHDEPHLRETGSGPGVVCLHANASTSGQWRGLMERLGRDRHVFAVDLYGSGKSPEWPSDREIALADEVRFIEPVCAKAGAPFSLVGHSYGAAVASIAALADPRRIASLVLYEPTLISLVANQQPPTGSIDGIQGAVAAAVTALDAGNRDRAAEHFIDFWMGAGSWRATPPERRAPIAAAMVNVRRWRHALVTEPTPLSAFAALEMPILYLIGEQSPESAQAVARVLVPVLPDVRVVRVPAWGHMAPMTHANDVDTRIAAFLRDC